MFTLKWKLCNCVCVVLGSVYVCPLFEIFVGLGVFYMKIYIKRHLQHTYSSHFLLLPFSVFFSSRYNAFGESYAFLPLTTLDSLDFYLNSYHLSGYSGFSLTSKSKNVMEFHPHHSVGIAYFEGIGCLRFVACLISLNNYFSHTVSLTIAFFSSIFHLNENSTF